MIPHPSMVGPFVVHVCLGVVLAVVLLIRWGSDLRLGRAAVLFAITVAASGASSWLTAPGPSGFSTLLALSWTLAVVLPVTGVAIAVRAAGHRPTQATFLSISVLASAVAVYAFVFEPYNLEVTHHRIHSERVHQPLRIAVIADLQTDAPGDHERAALRAVRDANPDLVLFLGDVIQHHDDEAYADGWATLASIATTLEPSASLGTFLVEGDSEYPHRGAWIPHAEALGMTVWPRQIASQRVRDDVILTGMGLLDSASGTASIGRPGPGFHIVFGHRPAFALGSVDADLLLAGHTHGGQVQLPGLGPILTLSKVPRSWASGRTELPGGATLLVSRGVGMERAAAPRIRFWCRPEVMVIDVLPH